MSGHKTSSSALNRVLERAKAKPAKGAKREAPVAPAGRVHRYVCDSCHRDGYFHRVFVAGGDPVPWCERHKRYMSLWG